jgi:hypothetical protein
MMMASSVVTIRLQPLRLPSSRATADSTESAGEAEVISAGCCGWVALTRPDIAASSVNKSGGENESREHSTDQMSAVVCAGSVAEAGTGLFIGSAGRACGLPDGLVDGCLVQAWRESLAGHPQKRATKLL